MKTNMNRISIVGTVLLGLSTLSLLFGGPSGCGGGAAASGGGSTPNFVVKGSMSSTGSAAALAVTGGSPTSWKVTFYTIYLSANEDCSDPVVIADFGTEGKEFELADNPTLVETSLSEGIYNCVIAKSKDVHKFKVDQASLDDHPGACTSLTTEYTYDIYRGAEVDSNLWVDVEGNIIPASGTPLSPGADTVFSFMSINPSAARAKNGAVPDPHQLVTLGSALVAPGQTTFYIDASDKVADWTYTGSDGSTDVCWLEQPATGFR